MLFVNTKTSGLDRALGSAQWGLTAGRLMAPCSSLPAFVQIGGQTFIRFEETLNWSSALLFCRRHYMDLANLQMVANGNLLRPITSGTEAWIGLYYNTSTRSKMWSSSLDTSIPPWLVVPVLEQSMCVGLRNAYYLAASATNCSCLQPFICFSGVC